MTSSSMSSSVVIFYGYGVDLTVPVDVASVDMDEGAIGIGGRDESYLLPGERVFYNLAGTVFQGIGTEKGTGGDKG
jgi:hypothetical protein